jgi:acyl-CoA reductase-like NAD-dependent aldehyde dehydrogenase
MDMLDCWNPATGETFDQVAMATAAEIQNARRELGERAREWAAKPARERARLLRQLRRVMLDATDEITTVINQDHGKSRQDALAEIIMTADKLHRYCAAAPRWLRRRGVSPGIYFFRRYYAEPVPYGVVAVIGPWNFPFDLTMSPVVSALLAGNTVMVKPSEVSAAVGAMMEELFQRVPELASYVRFLHGDGRVGAQIVETRPDLVFLTGSVATGKKVAQKAAELMIPFLSELGGKDPMIVLEDADIEAAAKWAVWGSNYCVGQACVGVERVYVVEPVYERFVQAALQETAKFTMGHSAAIQNPYHMGPLTFERQCSIIEEHLQDALAKGARILAGGRREGQFMEPTVVVDVDHSMKLMWDETFGPVLPIMKVRDEAHAIQLANHSYMGLSAYVWSGNLKRARRIAEQLQVGTVNINDVLGHFPLSLLPFGGMKQSGNARTHGRDEVIQFTQTRSVAWGLPPLAIDPAVMMRRPGHYWLGRAVAHLFFGVGLKQRLQAVGFLGRQMRRAEEQGREGAEESRQLAVDSRRSQNEHSKNGLAAKGAIAAGVATMATAVLWSVFRARR